MELNSIAFIPDGNRRYAKLSGYSLSQTYYSGTQKAWEVINWMKDYPDVKFGTFYTLSLENLHRSRTELKVLFKIFENELDKVKQQPIIEEGKIKLNFIGRKELFPKSIQAKMSAAEEFTAGNKGRTINLCLGYNGQAEIVDAAKKMALAYKEGNIDISDIDEKQFRKFLYSDFAEPDLIIRTGQTQRLSGFLTYQSAYSELYFSNKYWPEFNEAELKTAVETYHERARKFGK
jgi:undecaprenyl diphosphate synthase